MNQIRRYELECGECDQLTRQEFADGWRFCHDCDGLLININHNNCQGICKETT